MLQHNPPHPGEALREDVLPALGMNVSQAAQALGVSRVALSRLLNGHSAISSEMALRIEQWLGPENGGNAEVWLGLQAAYDLAVTRKAVGKKIGKLKRVVVSV